MPAILIDLRATVAMRAEDTRIARQHEEQAAARNMTPANSAAYDLASAWTAACAERERVARVALIGATS